jgi:arginase
MTISLDRPTHESAPGGDERQPPTYRIFGVPLRTGSLYPGSENDAQPFRDVGLIARLEAAGCHVVDDGDIAIPSYLPHHTIPPIRNWPGPRIVWDCVSDTLLPILRQPRQVPLLIGCDCSIVVGTAQALMRAAAGHVHVIYVDGDFDDAPPRPDRYQSAAAMALWLLTQPSPFWTGPPIDPARVTVIGWSTASQTQGGMRSISLADVQRLGARATARQVLEAIPAGSAILLHIDIDVFAQRELPTAYFPHADGLTLAEGTELLDVLLKDSRIRVIEVTEYAALRDSAQQGARQLVDLLASGRVQGQATAGVEASPARLNVMRIWGWKKLP